MKHFTIGGQDLDYSDGEVRYWNIRETFYQLARECRTTARKDYLEIMGKSEDPDADFRRFVEGVARQCAKKAVDLFAAGGCYLFDEASFLKDEYFTPYFEESLKRMLAHQKETAEAIEQELAEKQAEVDKDNLKCEWDLPQKSHWTVMIYNEMSLAKGKRTADARLRDSVKEFMTTDAFVQGITENVFDCVAGFHQVVCNRTNQAGQEMQCQAPGPSDTAMSVSMLNNYLSGRIPEGDKPAACLKLLHGLPCNPKVYELALELFGDADGQLGLMARTFHVAGYRTMLAEKLYDAFDEKTVSTDEELDEARTRMKTAAQRLGMGEVEAFPPQERHASDIAFLKRVVAGKVFDTAEEAAKQREVFAAYAASAFTTDAKACDAGIEAVRQKAQEAGVDAEWLLQDMETAKRRHEENSRVAFDYLFDSPEEFEAAHTSEEVFFKAVWAQIARLPGKTGGCRFTKDIGEGGIENIWNAMGVEPSNMFMFVDTAMMNLGRTGLAFTADGISVSNGSAIAGAVADNALAQKFLFKKAKDFLAQHRPKGASVSWAALLNDKTPAAVGPAGKLVLAEGVVFEGSSKQVAAVCELVNQLKSWTLELSVPIADGGKSIPDNVRTENPLTPWPDEKQDNPADYSYLGYIVERHASEAVDKGKIHIKPDIPEKLLVPFVSTPVQGINLANEDILCVAQSWGTTVALTKDLLLQGSSKGVDVAVRLDSITGLQRDEDDTDRFSVNTIHYEIISDCGGKHGSIQRCGQQFSVSGKGWLVEVLKDYLGDMDVICSVDGEKPGR